ncbi:MAG: TIGR03617 family F420-dependent LLM class oxidoreductase [Pseudomonadales bacterium]|nr:TIGR03617 family F420-dependent LLM class oxidoreductase [Pseudomonadales bacterium]
MKIDRGLSTNLNAVPGSVQKLEAAGYDGATSVETSHDPFFPLLLAAQNSERIELMTSIAVAFSRTPMLLANIAHDLNSFSKGRFVMGLGSQIQPHITKRFSMPWSSPAKRMRELILAMRAIWACWYEGEPLDFRGDFYTHSLMTPMFTPQDTEYGAPKVLLAGVGPLMTEVAGEVADGVILHAFTTEKYIREVSLPAIESGLAKSGRSRKDFQISYPAFVVTGRSEEEFVKNKKATCKQLAFYGSTPAYQRVLAIHGWGELQPELNRMSKEGKWDQMGALITDEILEAFAVVGEPEAVAIAFKQRYGDFTDRTSSNFLSKDDEQLSRIMTTLRA